SEWWILLPASHTRASLSSRLVCNGMHITVILAYRPVRISGATSRFHSFSLRENPDDATRSGFKQVHFFVFRG
ncbi:hypothetical protein, partial [Burkholderia ubonensis]|uniref:hypothetical protein n=1 Tax=Burkholderia ubonensis TaxID=101571 RepID=UPI001E42275B